MKKGFTLIELLAVIVILAIIALIATPIIINIINDARESSKERTIELYGTAVKDAIAKYQLTSGEVLAGTISSDILNTVRYNGSTVSCTVNKMFEDGGIYLSGCSINGTLVDYTYGVEQIKVTPATSSTKTTGNVPAGNYATGDEYIIKIGGEDRIFFILGENAQNSTKVDLIMGNNYTDETVPATMAWCANGGTNNSCNHDNLDPYIAHIQQVFGSNVTVSLPTIEQVSSAGCWVDYPSEVTCPRWLYDYLKNTNLYGYWTASPYVNSYSSAWYVYYAGYVSVINGTVFDDSTLGLRPVITISKSLLG